MTMSSIRLEYRAALSAKDWTEADRLVRANPSVLGTPPPGDLPVEITCIANDPMEPDYMVVEWSIQKNDCQGAPGCRPYTLKANQFDHVPAGLTAQEVTDWFDAYVQNRKDNAPIKDQLGSTLFLLKVDRVEQIVDFDGVEIT